MKIFKISELNDQTELESIIDGFTSKYKGLDLWVFENDMKIFINEIRIPVEMRRQGIGKEIISVLKDFASKRGKPLVLSPQAEKGYKKKLDDWYKSQGFVENKGRNKDYRISDPFSRTMYWKNENI
jgi:GNAT superfamily N-acetyltransferase